METKEVFQKACLLQLSTSVWTSSRMLEQAIMERIGTNADWLRGRKFLINPELLGPIKIPAQASLIVLVFTVLLLPVEGGHVSSKWMPDWALP